MNSNFERTLIVAAHPDDEILGCGGLIKKLTKKNKKIKVIFLAEALLVVLILKICTNHLFKKR